MTVEVGIVAGIVCIVAFTSYFASYFLSQWREEGENEVEGITWSRNLGVLFFLLSVVFVLMLIETLILLAQNEGVSYLTDSVLVVGLQLVMWSTIIGIGLYLFTLTLYSLKLLYHFFRNFHKGRKKGVPG